MNFNELALGIILAISSDVERKPQGDCKTIVDGKPKLAAAIKRPKQNDGAAITAPEQKDKRNESWN